MGSLQNAPLKRGPASAVIHKLIVSFCYCNVFEAATTAFEERPREIWDFFKDSIIQNPFQKSNSLTETLINL